jgi:hypothetical protein
VEDWNGATNLIVLVFVVHASLALFLRDDLTRVFHNDLIRVEVAIAANAIATVRGLDNLDANTVLAAFASTSHEIGKGAVVAKLLANIAIVVVAFVEHDSVLAILATAIVGSAHTLRVVEHWEFAPIVLRITNETI